ncbi:MAG: hypothetical protein JXA20_09740 [Spirochaetes bacterium]|nr:hypothetical protein [Spirochaetota bacterium]
MTKKIFRLSVIASLMLVAGLAAFAANYTVNGLSFNGVMVGNGDTDWLQLQGQEGTNPTVCLSHGSGVDFDIAVFNDGAQVCSNVGLNSRSCCTANTPGSVRVKVWSVRGSGSYSVTIRP